MSKFLKIVGENMSNINNPQAIFYLKLVDDSGNDIGYEPIQLRGTTYADYIYQTIKNKIGKGEDIGADSEEDNEIEAAQVLRKTDKRVDDEYKKYETVAKQKAPKIIAALQRDRQTVSTL
jgi:hypothetical protein